MKSKPFVTALVGFGRMGQGYSVDPVMARHFRFASHAQVLQAHPGFNWQAVIDPTPAALDTAREQWSVPYSAADVASLGPIGRDIEVAVLATGPEARVGLLDNMPGLRAVLVEKPLGRDLVEARAFLDECSRRGILVQVNLWRRADTAFRRLAEGQLRHLVGEPRAATCYYGNGVLNNGTHMIDFARMLFGEVAGVQLIGPDIGFEEGPLPGDRNPHFSLWMENGLTVDYQPLRFAEYRENGIVIWGDKGRLDILAEGLVIQHFPRESHRAMQGEHEVAIDAPRGIESSAGIALYEMFTNLSEALGSGGSRALVSPGESASETSQVVDMVRGLTPENPYRSMARQVR